MLVDPRRAVWLVAIALSLVAASARAEDKAAAKERYTHARSLYDLGHYAEAAKEFEAAYELKNDPAFLYDLAQSYRLAGNAEQALHFYRTYLRYVPKPANRAEIEGRIAALEQQLAPKGTGPAQAPGPVSATSPPPPPPEPGTAAAVTPLPGATSSTAASPIPAFPPPAAEPAAPPASLATVPEPVTGAPDPGRTLRIAGIATAGVGAFMVLVGIIEYSRASSASQEVESEAATGVRFDPTVEKRGQSAQTAEGWFLSLGLLAGAGGAALWYYGRRASAAAETPTYRISFAPVVTAGGGGGWLRLRF